MNVFDGIGDLPVFSPDLETVRTITVPGQARIGGESVARVSFVEALLPGDTLLAVARRRRMPNDPPGVGSSVLVRLPGDGTAIVIREWSEENATARLTLGTGYAEVGVPFAISVLTSTAPDGTRFGTVETTVSGTDGGSVRLMIVDDHGRELLNKSFPFEAIPIPHAEVEAAIQSIGRRRPDAPANRPQMPPDRAEKFRTLVRDKIPPTRSPIRSLVLAGDGRIWLQPRVEAAGVPWLILDASGQAQARVVLPAETNMQVAGRNSVWVLEADTFQVQSVVEYAVVGSRKN